MKLTKKGCFSRIFKWERTFLTDKSALVALQLKHKCNYSTVFQFWSQSLRGVQKELYIAKDIGLTCQFRVLPSQFFLKVTLWQISQYYTKRKICRCMLNWEDFCSFGILNGQGDTCCASSCGSCGGNGCKDLPGGKEQCCPWYIRDNPVECSSTSSVGCLMPKGVCIFLPPVKINNYRS